MAQLILIPSRLTLQLVERLGALQPGETVPYEELSSLIGKNIRQDGRSHAWSARQSLLRRGIVIHPIEGVGLKRLTDGEIADQVPPHRRMKIRRQAQRELKELHSADLGKLDRSQQSAVTAALAQAGTVLHLTDFRFVEEQKTQLNQNEPPKAPPLLSG